MSTAGRRCHDDERALLAELGRYIHLARTDIRQQRTIRKATKAAASSSSPQHVDPSVTAPPAAPPVVPSSDADAPAAARTRRRPRKTQATGSIWITFKAAVARMAPLREAKATKQAAFRRARSVTARTAAVTTAEAYFASALSQATDAGLDEEATDAYLAEQQHAAGKLLRREPLGAHLLALAQAAGVEHTVVHQALPDQPALRQQVAECIVRERVLSGDAGDAVVADPLEAADAYLLQATARAVHSGKKVVSDGGVLQDVVPGQCVVRIKNSGRRKMTAFLTNHKSVASFKASLAALLKKDVAPMLKHHKESLQLEATAAAAAAADDKKGGGSNAKKAPVPAPKAAAGNNNASGAPAKKK